MGRHAAIRTPEPNPDENGEADDIVAAFQIEAQPVRGRIARLGPSIDTILSAHAYPPSVAALAGEAVLLALIIGDALKFDGRLIVQASGEGGPVSFVVADFTVGEGVRGFAKFDAEAVAALEAKAGPRPGAEALLGKGALAMTIDQGPHMERYQGVVPLDGPSLSTCAEHYFAQSEQTPTRIRLAVGESVTDQGRSWRAGAAMIQKLAGDSVRLCDDEDWERALALFETTEDAELLDPDVSAGRLLYRLFHEDGVRLFEPRDVARRCSCDRTRLARILASFSQAENADMADDGAVTMTCEYCNRDWRFSLEDIAAARQG